MKQSKRMLAKERSFVAKLTNAQIENLLEKCGYILNKNVYDDFGRNLPTIERGYNSEKDEYTVFIRCIKTDSVTNNVANALKFNFPFMTDYDVRSSMIMLTDFSFVEVRLSYEDSSDNNKIYANFMYNLFGEYYRKKYNKYVRSEIKKQEQENIK